MTEQENNKQEDKAKVYYSIDEMPFYNWKQVYRTQDFRYVMKGCTSDNIDDFKFNKEDITESWETCYAQYVTDFALDGKLKKILKLESKIGLLTCKMYIDERPSLLTIINVHKKQLLKLVKPATGGADFDKQEVILEKWLGIRIDAKQISVRRFYTYLKMYEKEANKIIFDNAKSKKK